MVDEEVPWITPERLAKAFDGTEFGSVPNQNDACPLIDLGRRNIREFEKLSDKQRAIIFDLCSEIFADIIQPRTIEKCGCTDGPATASIIHDSFHFQQRMEQLGLDKQLQKELMTYRTYRSQCQSVTKRSHVRMHYIVYTVDYRPRQQVARVSYR